MNNILSFSKLNFWGILNIDIYKYAIRMWGISKHRTIEGQIIYSLWHKDRYTLYILDRWVSTLNIHTYYSSIMYIFVIVYT